MKVKNNKLKRLDQIVIISRDAILVVIIYFLIRFSVVKFNPSPMSEIEKNIAIIFFIFFMIYAFIFNTRIYYIKKRTGSYYFFSFIKQVLIFSLILILTGELFFLFR
jgi:hypothetical protein